MGDRGTVVWAPDPFKADSGNPRPWLIISTDRLRYADEESIGVAFTTQSRHPGSFAVPSEAWIQGEPQAESYVLPWTVGTLKDEIHVVGVQGTMTEAFITRVTDVLISYVDPATEA